MDEPYKSAKDIMEEMVYGTDAVVKRKRREELEHEQKLAAIRSQFQHPLNSDGLAESHIPERFRPLDEKYQVIEFDGRQFDLTKTQATVLKLLHTAQKAHRSSVGITEIWKVLGTNSGKMSQWFRGKNHALYDTLIIQTSSRNHYRLDA